MRIAIVGSRHFHDYDYIVRALADQIQPYDTIVSGGATGVDTLAERFAAEFTLHAPIIFKPKTADIQRYGFRLAAHARNGKIVEWSEKLYAFPCPCSTGTKNTIRQWMETPNKNFAPVIDRVQCGHENVR